MRMAAAGGRLALILTLASCGGEDAVRRDAPAPDAEPAIALEPVAGNLETPWGLAFAPDGRMFVTERPGRIRVIGPDGLLPEPWAEVDVVPPDYRSEGGLMGIAVAPDFESTGHVYVAATFVTERGLINRVLRFTDRDGRGRDETVIVEDLPEVVAEPGAEQAIHTHVGGGIGFGPDGMLYVTAGDATQPRLAQDPASPAGKLLRYRPDGTIPEDNPTPSSPVYALGLRNPQGLAWHPESGDAFVTDHGPSELSWERNFGGWFGDELNAIVPGGNYGWPDVVGQTSEESFLPPLVEWSPSIAPAGLTVYSGTELPWAGDLLVASLRDQHIRRVELARDESSPTGWRAVRETRLLEGAIGRIRFAVMSPDGDLYIASSNRDGRGRPDPEDDRIYRVVAGSPNGG